MPQSISRDPLKFAELRREYEYVSTIQINVHGIKTKIKKVSF